MQFVVHPAFPRHCTAHCSWSHSSASFHAVFHWPGAQVALTVAAKARTATAAKDFMVEIGECLV
jgi:hypothetical protein